SPRALLWAIVGVQLVAIVSLGTLTVLRFQIWAPIDEHGHFDYVQTIADQHRLPTIDPKLELGVSFGRHTYEAFQPPLYYAAAARAGSGSRSAPSLSRPRWCWRSVPPFSLLCRRPRTRRLGPGRSCRCRRRPVRPSPPPCRLA